MGLGFIKLDRGILDWQWWSNPTARALWVYLLMSANWKDGYLRDGNVVKRGQVCKSSRSMQDESGLSRKTLRKWIKVFEDSGEVIVNRDSYYSIITIVNYDRYQGNQDETRHNSNAPSNPTWGNSNAPSNPDRRIIRNKNKKNKNISCSSTDERYSDSHSEFDFESFWAKYPRKQNRLKAVKAFDTVCTTQDTYKKIIDGIEQQNRTIFTDRDMRYIPMPDKWLTEQRYLDDTNTYKPQQNQASKPTGHVYELPEYMKHPQEPVEKATDEEIAECERQIDELRKKMRERDAREGLNVIEHDNDPYADFPF